VKKRTIILFKDDDSKIRKIEKKKNKKINENMNDY